jgi:ribosome recycling factor
MNSLDRFSQSIAEDAQRSAILTYADARMLNAVDLAINAVKLAMDETSDGDNIALLTDAMTCLTGLKSNVEDGY